MSSSRRWARRRGRIIAGVLAAVLVAGGGTAWWAFSYEAAWIRANAALENVDGVTGVIRVGASINDAVIVMDRSATTAQIRWALAAGADDERKPPVRVGAAETATAAGDDLEARELTDAERGAIAETLVRLRNVPLEGIELQGVDAVSVAVTDDFSVEAAEMLTGALTAGGGSAVVKNITVDVSGASALDRAARTVVRLDEVDAASTLRVLERAEALGKWEPGVVAGGRVAGDGSDAFAHRVTLTASDTDDAVRGLGEAVAVFGEDDSVQLAAVVPGAEAGDVVRIAVGPVAEGRCSATVERVRGDNASTEASSCAAALADVEAVARS